MAKYVQWITHKGERILFVNGAGLREAEYMAALEEMKQELLKQQASVLVLIDATKTEMTTATVNKAKEVAATITGKGLPESPSAVGGLTGLQRATAQLFGRGVHFGATVEECKEWLVKEEKKRQKR